MNIAEKLEEVARRLATARRVTVVTGAGVSAASGVPTFRGAGGLWRNRQAQQLATPEAFAQDPVLVWEWYAWRRQVIADARRTRRTRRSRDGASAPGSRSSPRTSMACTNAPGTSTSSGITVQSGRCSAGAGAARPSGTTCASHSLRFRHTAPLRRARPAGRGLVRRVHPAGGAAGRGARDRLRTVPVDRHVVGRLSGRRSGGAGPRARRVYRGNQPGNDRRRVDLGIALPAEIALPRLAGTTGNEPQTC